MKISKKDSLSLAMVALAFFIRGFNVVINRFNGLLYLDINQLLTKNGKPMQHLE